MSNYKTTLNTVQEAAAYIRWYNGLNSRVPKEEFAPDGTDCGPGSKFSQSQKVCREAEAILSIGGCEIIACLSGQLAYRTGRFPNEIFFMSWEVGGNTNPCCQVLLREDRPSKRIRPSAGPEKFALSRQDAETLGILDPQSGQIDPPQVRGMFGSNVTVI